MNDGNCSGWKCKRECRKHLRLDSDKFYLIFVGRFTPDKGREIVIRTMNLLKDYPIKLLLIDDRGYSGELPSNVIYVGKVPNDEEIPLILDKVFPCHEVVKIDYMISGCPPPVPDH